MKKQYLWYACYGSNLNRKRFEYYIQGGMCVQNGINHRGCADTTPPVADRPLRIPYQMYFGNHSESWGGKGVAFINPNSKNGDFSLGRMYLVTKSQFQDIQRQEGLNREWYGQSIDLGNIDGYQVMTFTSCELRPVCYPSDLYLGVVLEGLRETYPHLSTTSLKRYLDGCVANRPAILSAVH